MKTTNMHNLETAANGFGELLDQVVFVGGATVAFYATAEGAPQSRLQPSYFLAAKLEAVRSRGWVDLRSSTDFEDVVYVLRNRSSILNDILETDSNVRQYITGEFAQFLARDDLNEAIGAVLDLGEPVGTAQIIRTLIGNISKIGDSPKQA
jgi:hypothetical protein